MQRSPALRRWAVLTTAFSCLTLLWILASPPASGPDENAHAVKAAAAARGDLVGRPDPEVGAASRIVRAPAVLDRMRAIAGCFAFQPTIPASCSPSFTGSEEDVDLTTRAGLSPPTYHVLTGLPLRISPSAPGLYAARATGGILAAGLVAAALTLASLRQRATYLVLGGLVAWTPTALYFTAVLNPSGLELSAALLVWVTAILLADPDGLPSGAVAALPWAAAVGASALLLARQLGPLWLALIALGVAPLLTMTRVRVLARWRTMRLASIPVGVASAAALTWLAVYKPLASKATSDAFDVSLLRAAAITFGRLGDVYTGAIGRFGWLDTPVPRSVEWLWTGLLFGLLGLGWALGARRVRIALGVSLLVAVAAPPLIEASQLDTAGLVWQSRYTLPLAFGAPLLAGHALDRRRPAVDELRSWATLCIAGVGIAHLAAFYVALRRYVVGTDGPVWFLGATGWEPPLPPWLLLLAFIAALSATGWWLHHVVSSGGGAPDDQCEVVAPRRDTGLGTDLVIRQ
ncbi:MAG: DUF2142 domain-containing protein [Acidimicrobiales bacterium]